MSQATADMSGKTALVTGGAAGLGRAITVGGELLVPRYSDTSISDYVLLPASVGEIGACLWLLLVGARQPKGSAA